MTELLDQDGFVARFGGVYEHSPWIASDSWEAARSATTSAELSRIFTATVDAASESSKLELIRAHPDLAGRIALAGELTRASASEQASAGLDQCSADEYQQFQSLNQTYVSKFEFPFVMAIKNSSRSAILAAFAQRLENTYADEFDTAIREIHKIARLRLEQLCT